MTLMGVVQNFGQLCATRFFLGLFEAGFFPGAIYLVGQWYPPDRTQFRMALFYCASVALGAFSGLLAAAIAKMNGKFWLQLLYVYADRFQGSGIMKDGAGSSSSRALLPYSWESPSSGCFPTHQITQLATGLLKTKHASYD